MKQIRNWLVAILATALFWGLIALFFKYTGVFFVLMLCVVVVFTLCACKCLLIDEIFKP